MNSPDTRADQPAVLIISDSAEFARAIASRWQTERSLPLFTMMSSDLGHGVDGNGFALAIVGSVPNAVAGGLLAALEPCGKPVLFVCEDGTLAKQVREQHSRVMLLRQYEGWLDALVLVCSESLRRIRDLHRAQHAEQAAARLERDAVLGRYMLEMRHTLNNALTSILGNSELLLLEPGSLSAMARSQAETIRNMATRIHEIQQRFSSLEKELNCVESHEMQGRAEAHAVAGW